VRHLVLMRHAKSAYPDGVGDHARPLAARGEREGALAGEWIRANVGTVDAVLCSSATRTRQTLTRTGIAAPVTYLDELYDTTPGETLRQINTVADDVTTLLVVGHEPTTSDVALRLAGPGSDREAAERIYGKFPTSGIAVLAVPTPWSELGMEGATLVGFHVPR
jgi:phosphohistidine phosphatase